MSGAWEIPPNVLVGILHTEHVPLAWAFGFRNLIIPGRLPPMPVSGMPYDHGRNTICHHALNIGADAVFMFDSDVIPPRDAILRLLQHRKPIVSGMYCRRSPPHGVPVAMKNGQWFTQFQMGGTYPVDLVGSGCLLLSREFLIDMAQRFPQDVRRGKIWFDWKSDMPRLQPGEVYDPRNPKILPHEASSEDFTMCIAARKHGYEVLLDTSIRCKHDGLAESDYAEYKPAEIRVLT